MYRLKSYQSILLMSINPLYYIGFQARCMAAESLYTVRWDAAHSHLQKERESIMESVPSSIYPGDEPFHELPPFVRGMRDAIPVGLGYFAVSFSLGIAAANVGFSIFQGFLLSLTSVSSSGEYAGLMLFAENAPYFKLALMVFIANARYLLMSCAISQKFNPKESILHRILIGFGLTDELFGLAIASDGHVRPIYMYGAFVTSLPLWALGTAFGVFAGNVLPPIIAEAMNVAIFGMFLAIIIPPCKKDRVVLGAVGASFLISFLASVAPLIRTVSSGTRTLILTVLISAVVASLFPVPEIEEAGNSTEPEPGGKKTGSSEAASAGTENAADKADRKGGPIA